jgi:hypothetical protein
MWGCVWAAAITFPLVFGWIHFRTVDNDFTQYRTFFFGFPVRDFTITSMLGFIVFHGLMWAAFFVIAGVMLAMRRRMVARDAAATQLFGEDFLPLILLFAISITGLMLTVSYSWLKGYAYDFLAILHAITVIFTLLWLPFGKFFHIFQRPAQLGVSFYKDVGQRIGRARCARCGEPYAQPFASEMMIQDLTAVVDQLGFSYQMHHHKAAHYQRICPKCRRAMFGLAQGRLWEDKREEEIVRGEVK